MKSQQEAAGKKKYNEVNVQNLSEDFRWQLNQPVCALMYIKLPETNVITLLIGSVSSNIDSSVRE